MGNFDDREKTFENKYAHDQELEFKAKARRAKLLALWVAPLLGLTDEEAARYSKELAMTAHEKRHDDVVVQKILKDLEAKGIPMTEHKLRKQLADLTAEARAQVMSQAKD
jgi:hypothetical protein